MSKRKIDWVRVLWNIKVRYWPLIFVGLWTASLQNLTAVLGKTFFPDILWLVLFGAAIISALLLTVYPRSIPIRAMMFVFGSLGMVVRIYAIIRLFPVTAATLTFVPLVSWVGWVLVLTIWIFSSLFFLEQGGFLRGKRE